MSFVYENKKWFYKDNRGQKQLLQAVIGGRPQPFYLYDLEDIANRVDFFRANSNLQIHYAMKANSHPDILNLMKRKHIGVDVVSLGELERAIQIGFMPQQIVFSGVGKSVAELTLAMQLQVRQINVESLAELQRILQLAKQKKQIVDVALRLNPDVETLTHPYIQTGFRENKFGIDSAFLQEVVGVLRSQRQWLRLCGLTLHIGSQIQDLHSFREAFLKAKRVFLDLRQEFSLSTFDVGGGLGIDYGKDGSEDFLAIQSYLQVIDEVLSDLPDVSILAEPGRILVARAGVLVCQVEYVKETPYKNFVIVNTGMHHFLRPALYQAVHRIEKLESTDLQKKVYDVVGPICESSDTLGHSRILETVNEGETLLIFDVGAYGAVMASNYNLHAKPNEVVL